MTINRAEGIAATAAEAVLEVAAAYAPRRAASVASPRRAYLLLVALRFGRLQASAVYKAGRAKARPPEQKSGAIRHAQAARLSYPACITFLATDSLNKRTPIERPASQKQVSKRAQAFLKITSATYPFST